MTYIPPFATGLAVMDPADVIRAEPSGPALEIVGFRLKDGETAETPRAPIRWRLD